MTNRFLSITNPLSKYKRLAAALTLMWGALASPAIDLQGLAKSLGNIESYKGTLDVVLSVPMSPNDVHYNLQMASALAPADTLSAVDYLIAWTHPTPSGTTHGFTSYFDGNLYRYREGSRLAEYHAGSNLSPFVSSAPVQKTAQFHELLPQDIGQQITDMLADSTYTLKFYPDTLFRGNPSTVLKAVREIKGSTAAEMTFVFDRSTLLPVYINKEMSPGAISEQTLTYNYHNGEGPALPRSEAELIALYPEEFANFREGSYALASLKGRPLPAFSLPKLQGERLSHEKGTGFAGPTIIAFVDESVGSTPDVLKQTRKALDAVPMTVQMVWVFLSNRQDDIAELFGPDDLIAETVLYSGRTVVKDFGITETPSFIFVDRSGKVNDVHTGFNKDLTDIVIQKTTLLK